MARVEPYRIDVHHHVVPPAYLAEIASRHRALQRVATDANAQGLIAAAEAAYVIEA